MQQFLWKIAQNKDSQRKLPYSNVDSKKAATYPLFLYLLLFVGLKAEADIDGVAWADCWG